MGKPNEYTKAENIAAQVVGFYADLCARRMPLGGLAEFSFLVEWYEAAQAAQAVALNLRDWHGVDQFDAMVDEAGRFLDLYHADLAQAA